ncbi:MAG: aspartate aminotransferase family protein [Thermomicrobiales bacterium]|nr:aspartate aminotransferase family protein [Thermomicrobiales bacterium]
MVEARSATDIDTLVATYVARNPRSAELAARAHRVMPGGNTRTGVWMNPFPPYIARASGVFLEDVDGHQLLDWTFNNSSLILGHAHPAVVEAIQAQAALGTGYNRPTELEIDLAEEICRRVPSVAEIRFCNSGTEAVMNALRAAIAFTGRRKIVKFEGAYNGTSDHALVSLPGPVGPESGPASRPRPVPSSAGLSAAAEEVVVLPFNDMEACEALLAEHAHELAAVIIDPLMTNAGVILPEASFLTRLREVTQELGILLIFDEIIAFRIAPGGAQQRYGITPDLTAFGKIMAGGTPGGAFGGRAEIMRLYDPTIGARIPQSGTFNANPLTLVAGLTTLRLLTPDVYERMEAMAQRLVTELVSTLREAGVTASGSAVGSIFRVYLTEQPPRAYRETAGDNTALQRRLTLWLLNHETQWQQGGYISTVTEDHHLDQLVSLVRQAAHEL